MGLIKLGLVGAAGYAIARKYNHSTSNDPNSSKRSRSSSDSCLESYRDTKSGYMHQGYCNGQCGRTCNGQQTHGLHDSTCNTQCGGQCVTQRRTAGSPLTPAQSVPLNSEAQSYYAAGGLGEREMLPSYQSSAMVAAPRTADVKV